VPHFPRQERIIVTKHKGERSCLEATEQDRWDRAAAVKDAGVAVEVRAEALRPARAGTAFARSAVKQSLMGEARLVIR